MTDHAGRAVFEVGIADPRGNRQAGRTVSVYERNTSNPVTLYTDRTKTTELADNTTSTDSLGNLEIYADPGDYDAHVNGAVIRFTVLPDWADIGTGDADAVAADLATLEAELPDTYAPIAEVDDRIAGDAALDTRIDDLEAGSASDTGAITVLQWNHHTPQSVLHGQMWPDGNQQVIDLGPFYWEVWCAPAAVWLVERDSTAGTFTLTLNGETTDPIPASAAGFTEAAIQAAIDALPAVVPGDVIVTGLNAASATLEFVGAYLGGTMPALTVNTSLATGGSVTASVKGAEYWLSEGFGGAHRLLAGFGGGNPAEVTGNVYNGVGNTSFNAQYLVQWGEWVHVAIVWDGAYLWVLINRIVCGKTPFAGPARSQYGQLMVGGSDHSNFCGRIAQLRGYEGQTNGQILWYGRGAGPDRHFADEVNAGDARSQFATSYIDGGVTFPDLSDGYGGRLHPGHLYVGNGFSISTLGRHPRRVPDPTAPFGNQMRVARTRIPAPPVAAPVGAKIWDSFGREDSIEAFTDDVTLGSTEGGSLGVKAWETSVGHWGTFDGSAIALTFSQFARVPNDSPDMSVRVQRVLAHGLFYTTAAARITADRALGWYAEPAFDYMGVEYIVLTRPDGTQVGSWLPSNTDWTFLRLDASGTTFTVYVDDGGSGWELLHTATGETANQSEVGGGLRSTYAIGTQARYLSFEVR